MDIAREELGHILSTLNPFAWSLETSCTDPHQYYFLDANHADSARSTTTTSLMRLVSLHTTPIALRNFLFHAQQHEEFLLPRNTDQTITSCTPYQSLNWTPPRLDDTTAEGVHALHILVHRNSFYLTELLPIFLSSSPHLVSTPIPKSNTYPLHILAGHSLTIPTQAFQLLYQACPQVAHTEDCRGDTPLSLLYKSVLRFQWSRRWELSHANARPAFCWNSEEESDDMSWMTMISPSQYWKLSMMLIDQSDSWFQICRIHRCPPLLIRMIMSQKNNAMSLSNALIQTEPQTGQTPLQIVCASRMIDPTFLPDELLVLSEPSEGRPRSYLKTNVVDLILQACPLTASIPHEKDGYYPLHVAVTNPTLSVFFLRDLIAAHPPALYMKDPRTGWLPLVQYASTMQEHEENLPVMSFLFEMGCQYGPECILPM